MSSSYYNNAVKVKTELCTIVRSMIHLINNKSWFSSSPGSSQITLPGLPKVLRTVQVRVTLTYCLATLCVERLILEVDKIHKRQTTGKPLANLWQKGKTRFLGAT